MFTFKFHNLTVICLQSQYENLEIKENDSIPAGNKIHTYLPGKGALGLNYNNVTRPNRKLVGIAVNLQRAAACRPPSVDRAALPTTRVLRRGIFSHREYYRVLSELKVL